MTGTFDPAMRVRDARDLYLRENGFTLAGYSEPTAVLNLSGIRLRIPNPKARQHNIRFHDLHHVLTGFGTDPTGEGEIAAWQYRSGLPRSLFLRGLITLGLLLGLLVAPRRVMRAWRLGRGARSLFVGAQDYEALLDLEVGELRARCGLPIEGIGCAPARTHAGAPAPSRGVLRSG